MKFISHRGNMDGPMLIENHPGAVGFAIHEGFDVEVDLWQFKGSLWLGHDEPMYKVPNDFLLDRQSELWCHAKNVGAAVHLSKMGMRVFSHADDPFVMTNRGDVIVHYDAVWHKGGIIMCPEMSRTQTGLKAAGGICSDNIEYYKKWYGEQCGK